MCVCVYVCIYVCRCLFSLFFFVFHSFDQVAGLGQVTKSIEEVTGELVLG